MAVFRDYDLKKILSISYEPPHEVIRREVAS